MVKVKKEKAILKKAKSRAKYERPEKLGVFIDDDNRLLPDVVLQNPQEVYENNKKIFLTEDGKSWLAEDGHFQALKKSVKECFSSLPDDFCDYIKEKSIRNASIHQNNENYSNKLYQFILQNYDEFRQNREDLRSYADYFTNCRKHGHITIGEGGMYGANGTRVDLPEPRSIYQKKNTKEGWVTTVIPVGLSEALHNVIGDRVRTCEICGRVFWAKRFDSETCSPPCLNILNVHRHRNLTDEEKAKRKAQREAVKKSKEEQKLGKERAKKNGTL